MPRAGGRSGHRSTGDAGESRHAGVNVYDLAGPNRGDRLSKLRTNGLQDRIPETWGDDHDDADLVARQRLLELHTPVRRHEDIEVRRRAPEQRSVLEASPAFFLDRSDNTSGKLAAELAWHVFVEEDALHAILASNAWLAASRNATAVSRVTPG